MPEEHAADLVQIRKAADLQHTQWQPDTAVHAMLQVMHLFSGYVGSMRSIAELSLAQPFAHAAGHEPLCGLRREHAAKSGPDLESRRFAARPKTA